MTEQIYYPRRAGKTFAGLVDQSQRMKRRIEELEARLAGVDAGTHVIVPVEPTFDMMTNGVAAFSGKEEDGDSLVKAYKAMIKAAQEGK